MPGTITYRSCWLPWRMAPKKARNRSGSMKMKNAALGLRQNSGRTRRYCRQAIAAISAILARLRQGAGLRAGFEHPIVGRERQVDILERGTGDCQALEILAAGERVAG